VKDWGETKRYKSQNETVLQREEERREIEHIATEGKENELKSLPERE